MPENVAAPLAVKGNGEGHTRVVSRSALFYFSGRSYVRVATNQTGINMPRFVRRCVSRRCDAPCCQGFGECDELRLVSNSLRSRILGIGGDIVIHETEVLFQTDWSG